MKRQHLDNEAVTLVKRRKGCIMSYDIGEATKGLENEAEFQLRHSSFHNPSVASPTSLLRTPEALNRSETTRKKKMQAG